MKKINVVLKKGAFSPKETTQKTLIKNKKDSINKSKSNEKNEQTQEIQETQETIIENNDIENLKESVLYFINNECLTYLSYPNYEDKIKEQIELYLETILPKELFEQLDFPYDEIIEYYFSYFHEPRSYSRDLYTGILDFEATKKQMNVLMNKEQPEQKSDEWYKYRHNLITASSAWKIIDSESSRNQYIYSKCKPINISNYKNVNINSPFHWGHKYEPLSVSLYEYLYKTKIMDFGCIPHDNYYFIGASPDGINVDETSPLYGRMLEIKNIVNREITGIPKREYWIQMQLQMEVCNLPECDFLECRFKEYETKEEFYNDGTFQYTKENKMKGIKIVFDNGIEPIYEYCPFMCDENEYNVWKKMIMKKNASLTWIKDIYWRLDQYSCVLVPRNKEWFNSVVTDFENIWKIIEKERIHGYEHRKPKKQKEKNKNKLFDSIQKVDSEALIDSFFIETEQQEENVVLDNI